MASGHENIHASKGWSKLDFLKCLSFTGIWGKQTNAKERENTSFLHIDWGDNFLVKLYNLIKLLWTMTSHLDLNTGPSTYSWNQAPVTFPFRAKNQVVDHHSTWIMTLVTAHESLLTLWSQICHLQQKLSSTQIYWSRLSNSKTVKRFDSGIKISQINGGSTDPKNA